MTSPRSSRSRCSLKPFEDGGWIWFDITTDTKVSLLNGGWYAAEPAPGTANIAVGIPTFNRPADCVNALHTLTADPLVDEVIGAVIVPDQGVRKVRDHPDFPAAAARLGNRLSMHDQPNLGGSGGYSRVMYEALKNTDCQQILFMDDDIRIEPDSILRVLAMHRFAKTPMLVGGQMLNLQEPSHLHIMGEVVNQSNFMWTAAPHAEYDHDFAEYPLNDKEERSKLLHRRIDVEFNGWWTCMIPRQVAEELGQPLPLFIKWDDAEYGLRAGEHGYPTVTLPGAAIWHMAWSDKDDAIDWQAYFHLRNRLVVAAMHWDGDVSGLVRSHLKATLKHLACLEYSTVAIQNRAIDDFLAGPEHIFSILESALPEVHRHAQGIPGRGGAAGGQRAAAAVEPEQGDEAAGEPGVHQLPAGPRHTAQPQARRPASPRASGVQRADAGRPLVPAVHGRRRHRHDGRWRAAWSTASATGARCSRCCSSHCAGSVSWRAASTRCAGCTATRCPCCRASRNGRRRYCRRGCGSGQQAQACLNPGHRAAKSPRWLPSSRRWLTGRVVLTTARATVALRGAQHRLGRRVAARRAADAAPSPGLAGGRRRRVRRPCGRCADQAGGTAQAAASSGRGGERRHTQPAELPVGACHLHHGGGHPDGPSHRVAAARVARPADGAFADTAGGALSQRRGLRHRSWCRRRGDRRPNAKRCGADE